jgi:hypothetical protein
MSNIKFLSFAKLANRIEKKEINMKEMEKLDKIKNQREHYKTLHFKETKEEWHLDKKAA